MEYRNFQVGSAVVWHDENGQPRPALITAIHGSESNQGGIKHYPCVNLVATTIDASKTDPYGRQIERQTSVPHRLEQSAHGRYWRWDDEPLNPVAAVTRT
jgi:hypothetical protein